MGLNHSHNLKHWVEHTLGNVIELKRLHVWVNANLGKFAPQKSECFNM